MANTKLSDLTASSSLVGTELFYSDNGTVDVKVTATQLRTFSQIEVLETISVAGSTLAGVGTSLLTTTGGTNVICPAPSSAGIRKVIISSNATTVDITVTGATTLVQFGGSTNSRLVFDAAFEAIELLSVDSARWAIISNSASVGLAVGS